MHLLCRRTETPCRGETLASETREPRAPPGKGRGKEEGGGLFLLEGEPPLLKGGYVDSRAREEASLSFFCGELEKKKRARRPKARVSFQGPSTLHRPLAFVIHFLREEKYSINSRNRCRLLVTDLFSVRRCI